VPTILDTTVLSNFAAVEGLDLLRLHFESAYIASAVYEEVRRGIEDGYSFLTDVDAHIIPLSPHGWIRVVLLETNAEAEMLRSLPPELDHGEAVSLAIAKVRGWSFFTDDSDARHAGRDLGVPVGGTLGVLLQLVRSRRITMDEANGLLAQMIAHARYWSPVSDLRLLGPE
jgi:predicted nucleic acid-binding protein